MVYVGAS